MMTFKEYLIESRIMSSDALKQAMSDYEQRGIGKPEAKPSKKRLSQMDKRKARKAGEEEEEVKKKRGRPKTPEFLKRQSDAGQPKEKLKRGRPKTPEMLKRQAW